MPRKSLASMSVVPLGVRKATRLQPPAELSERQRELWKATVAPLPADYFARDQVALLKNYVVHCELAETLTNKLSELDPASPDWARVSAAQVSHSKSMLAFARALRLTSISRLAHDTAGRAIQREAERPSGPRPWETGT